MEYFSDLTTFDLIVLGIVGFSALIGLKRGFATEFLTLASWAGAIFLTLFALSFGAKDLARNIIQPDAFADIVTAIVLFFGGLIIFKMIARMIGDSIKKSAIGALDRSLGALFGILRGSLIVSAMYLITIYFVSEKSLPNWVEDGKLRPLASYGAHMLGSILPNLPRDIETSDILDKMEKTMEGAPQAVQKVIDNVKAGAIQKGAKELIEKVKDEIKKATEEKDNNFL